MVEVHKQNWFWVAAAEWGADPLVWEQLAVATFPQKNAAEVHLCPFIHSNGILVTGWCIAHMHVPAEDADVPSVELHGAVPPVVHAFFKAKHVWYAFVHTAVPHWHRVPVVVDSPVPSTTLQVSGVLHTPELHDWSGLHVVLVHVHDIADTADPSVWAQLAMADDKHCDVPEWQYSAAVHNALPHVPITLHAALPSVVEHSALEVI